jgi:iron complex outermembrane recepter protein
VKLVKSSAVLFLIAALGLQARAEAADDEGQVLDEIVVTATKRPERVQSVPAAMSVITSDSLKDMGVNDLPAAQTLIPSVRLNVENDVTQVVLRGIGVIFDGAWIPETVSIIAEGQNLPRFAASTQMYDLTQLEVLPGPQGTLYGRGAVGGVINMGFARPAHDSTTEVLLDGGNYGLFHGSVAQNIPVSDTLALRAVVTGTRHDGYNDNGSYDQNSYAGRLSALYTPSDDLSAYLWGSYYRNDDRPSPLPYFPAQASAPFNIPPYDSATRQYYPPFGAALNISEGQYESQSGGAELDYLAGPVKLTYVGSYLHYTGNDTRVVAGFFQPTNNRINQTSQELRVANTDAARVDYLGALFWQKNNTTEDYVFGPNFGGGHIPNQATSYAAYGQATYHVLEHLRATLGGRYSGEQLNNDSGEAFYPSFDPQTFQFDRGIVPYTIHERWNHVNWKVGLEGDLTKTSLLYGSVQTGFSPGTYDANAVPVTPDRELQSQEVLAYTLGIKNQFWDRRLTFNVEAFWYDYTNLIVNQYDAATGSIIVFNAPKSRFYGGQLDTQFQLTRHDQIALNVGGLSARIKELSVGQIDYAGYKLPYAPDATVSLSYKHDWSLVTGATISAAANSYFNSGYLGLFTDPSFRQPSYTKTDLSIRYVSPDGTWEFGIWAKNLEDHYVIASSGATGAPAPYSYVAALEPPRTFGGTVRLHLGH